MQCSAPMSLGDSSRLQYSALSILIEDRESGQKHQHMTQGRSSTRNPLIGPNPPHQFSRTPTRVHPEWVVLRPGAEGHRNGIGVRRIWGLFENQKSCKGMYLND